MRRWSIKSNRNPISRTVEPISDSSGVSGNSKSIPSTKSSAAMSTLHQPITERINLLLETAKQLRSSSDAMTDQVFAIEAVSAVEIYKTQLIWLKEHRGECPEAWLKIKVKDICLTIDVVQQQLTRRLSGLT